MGGAKRGSSTERSSRDNWPSTPMTGRVLLEGSDCGRPKPAPVPSAFKSSCPSQAVCGNQAAAGSQGFRAGDVTLVGKPSHTYSVFSLEKSFSRDIFSWGGGWGRCSFPSTVIRGQWLDEQRGDQLFLIWQLRVPRGPDSQAET